MTAPVVIGVDISAILKRLDDLETNIMTTQAEAFAALTAAVEDVKADFTALLEQLAIERENLSDAGQAAFDTAVASLATLDDAVGDADGSDTPEPPAEPTEPEPAPVDE